MLILLVIIFSRLCSVFVFAQHKPSEIDSLVLLMRTAGKEWNDYANPLIRIGEPAVSALVKNAEDKFLSQWNRRISIMTLNKIHSEQWKEPALKILFDKNEDHVIRNQVIAGLSGFNLQDVKNELWELYNSSENGSYKSNIANLLLTADSTLAYTAFCELFNTCDGYIQKNALQNLVQLRPEESTAWYLKGIQLNDWMTANLAMDSLILSTNFLSEHLISLYNQPGTDEKVQWRIIYVFGHRNEIESVPVLVNALQNESWLVNNEAAVGLCRFDAEKVIMQMKNLKNDKLPFVKQNAKWVIEKLKNQ